MVQPLTGLRVLDFTTLLPGPLATLMLAEAGAEVIKIERPEGEDLRRYEPLWEGGSALFALLNAGKKSLKLDLARSDARRIVQSLIATADVLVEQFRPGVMARHGLGYAEAAALNPRLVYCSITGYGQAGPLAGRAGHDLNYMSETGVLALNPGPADAPQVPPVLAADIAGGSYPAVINILLALAQRERTGQGMHLDIAMADGLFPFAFWALPGGWLGRGWPEPGGGMLTGGSPRYRLYPTSDGRLLAVAALEEKFWRAFCDAIDLPAEWRAETAGAAGVIEAVGAAVAGKPAAHWEAVFAQTDCCCLIVRSLAEACGSPHFLARGLFDYRVAAGSGATLPALPLPVARAFRAAPDAPRRLREVDEEDLAR